jgi:hypothetical protein
MKRTNSAKKEAPKPKKDTVIVRAMRVEIGKPIGFGWDELGKILRARFGIAHRAMNAAIIAVHVASKDAKNDTALQTVAYKAAGEELESFKAWALAQRDPVVQALGETHIPGGMQSAWATHAYGEWRKFAKSRGEDGFPTHRKGQPIMVRRGSDPKSREWGLTIDEGGQLVLHANLDSTRDHMVGHRRLTIRPGRGAQWALLRELASGEGTATLGDLKIIYDKRARRKDGKRGKWYGIIAYSRPITPRPESLDPKRALIIHRGAYNAITAMGTDGFYAALARGGKLAVKKKRLHERRRQIQDSMKRAEIGKGACGHGRKRRLKPLTDIDDKEARVIHTFCQQNAAAIRKLCIQRGYGTVVIGEYGGIQPHEDREIRRFVPRFPLHEQKSCIVNALQPLGVEVIECDERYVSQICPVCDNCDPRNHHVHRGMFHCTDPTCNYDREVDWVSTLHMLRRAGVDRSEWDRRLETHARFVKASAKKKGDIDTD